MTSILEKRKALHRNLEQKKKENDVLKFQLGQLQAIANIGVFTCMIAHEINNLLTPLSNYAMLALNNPDDSELSEKALKKTLANSEKATKVMQSILSVANGESIEKRDINLKYCIDEIFSCLCRDFKKDKIEVNVDIPDDVVIHAVPVQFQQVLMNLILNARDAMLKKGGKLQINVEIENNFTVIEISDTGCGIPQKDIERIFDPFFSTKTDEDNTSSGSGLGLAFCKKIIAEHGGLIEAASCRQEGTTFSIKMPN